jgi:hypothetical protein
VPDKPVAIWEDGAVVYHLSDGSFKALKAAAAMALQSLRTDGPTTADGLVRRMLDETPTAEELAQLEGLLTQLHGMGLLQRGET